MVAISVIKKLVEDIENIRSEIKDVVRIKTPNVEVAIDPDGDEVRTAVSTRFLLEGMRHHENTLVAALTGFGVEIDD